MQAGYFMLITLKALQRPYVQGFEHAISEIFRVPILPTPRSFGEQLLWSP